MLKLVPLFGAQSREREREGKRGVFFLLFCEGAVKISHGHLVFFPSLRSPHSLPERLFSNCAPSAHHNPFTACSAFTLPPHCFLCCLVVTDVAHFTLSQTGREIYRQAVHTVVFIIVGEVGPLQKLLIVAGYVGCS